MTMIIMLTIIMSRTTVATPESIYKLMDLFLTLCWYPQCDLKKTRKDKSQMSIFGTRAAIFSTCSFYVWLV